MSDAGAEVSLESIGRVARPPPTLRETLKDIDAILARLDVGIAAEHRAMDELLARIRRPG